MNSAHTPPFQKILPGKPEDATVQSGPGGIATRTGPPEKFQGEGKEKLGFFTVGRKREVCSGPQQGLAEDRA